MPEQAGIINEIEKALAPDARIDTQFSVVFLKDDRAYKLKRETRTGFLDYSSLRKRKALCEREFLINRKNSPELYEGVVPVYRVRGGDFKLWLGRGMPPAPPEEYLLEMRRFDEGQLLSNLAKAGALTVELTDSVVKRVLKMHAAAAVFEVADYSRSFRKAVDIAVRQFRDSVRGVAPAAAPRMVAEKLARALKAGEPVLRMRGRGAVRECHGDLHLGNICLYRGRPRIFDAVEFNSEFTRIDALYDFAFLLMDYSCHKLDALAERAAGRYRAAAGINKDDFAALMPLYLGMRAVIRSSISAAGSKKCACPGAAKRLRKESLKYYSEALKFLS